MLRVSSYRKLFEDNWGQNGVSSVQCAGQYRSSARASAADECDCDKLDFVAAKALNKEGLNQFAQDRMVIASLNDRLVRLIEMGRCLEEENEYLECQIEELEEQLSNRQTSSAITALAEPDWSLEAVVNRLRKERDEIICETEELQKELEWLKQQHEEAVCQRSLCQQERQDVAGEVDAVTAECLALREQVAIYEEQLANMEARHKMELQGLMEPDGGTAKAMVVATEFGCPDVSPAGQLIEYYCQLADCIKYDCGVTSAAVVPKGDVEAGGVAVARLKDLPETMDINQLEMLVSELQLELEELEKCNDELEDEVTARRAAHMDEIAELECTIDEMKQQEVDLQAEMKEQCEEYKELLSEKMARDMEIVAYRGLVDEEEDRLCDL